MSTDTLSPAQTYNPPRRFAGIEHKVNRFFLLALVGLIGLIGLVSYKQGLFVRHVPLYFLTTDAMGISKGMSIRLFGFQVGVVSGLLISEGGVKVDLAITEEHIIRIVKGSRIKLVRESYIGGASLQIMPPVKGEMPATVIQAGDELVFVASPSMGGIVDDLRSQVTPLISDMRGVLAEFNHPDSDYRRSIKSASEFVQQLPGTNQDARRLLKSADHAVQSAETTLVLLSRVGEQAQQQLPVLVGKAAVTMDSISGVAEQLQVVTRDNGAALNVALQSVPTLMREAGGLMRNANDLVQEAGDVMLEGRAVVGAVRQVWPIRNILEPRATRTLTIDSFESAVPAQSLPALAPQP